MWRGAFELTKRADGVEPVLARGRKNVSTQATSLDGGRTWARFGDGSAIVEPGVAPLGTWTDQVIGTPYIVAYGGALRLYHCAKQNPETNMSIGLLVSESRDFTADAWRGVDV